MVRRPRPKASAHMIAWVAITSLRRSSRSAAKPVRGSIRSCGPNCNDMTTPTAVALLCVSWVRTSQSWAVLCIQVPTLETSAPMDQTRKLKMPSDRKAPVAGPLTRAAVLWTKRSLPGVEEVDDLLRRAALAQPWENQFYAVGMGVRVQVGHGIDSQGYIEPVLIGMTCGGLEPYAGGEAEDHDLRDAELLQVLVEVGVGEGAPRPLRDEVIFGLPVQLGNQVGEIRGELPHSRRRFCAAGRAPGNVHEHDRQMVTAEGIEQLPG